MLIVTCAIIEHEGKVLVTKRSSNMTLPNKWEFPGGKIEENEPPEDCVVREIMEELSIVVHPVKKLTEVTHSYPNMTIILVPFICRFDAGEIILKEHANYVWAKPIELIHLDWADADIPIMTEYLQVVS